MERVLRFLVSRKSLVGFALAGAGLALNLLGWLPMGPFWLTVVVGLYVLGAVLTPRERGPKVQLDAAADAAALRDGLDELLHQVRFKIAPDLFVKVESIRKSILATLDESPDRNAADPTVYLIRHTALDYLPSALSAYIALPRLYAERRPAVNGRTPHDVLLEQLDLMDTRMHEAYDAMITHDTERLAENGRFLADRFGKSALRLDVAPGDARTAEAVPAASAVPDADGDEQARTTTDAAEARERVH